MQLYDLLMVAVLGGAVLFGLWKGFAWQVASLASIFVSYFVARNFSTPVAAFIGGDPAWNRFLAMFILFFGCSLGIWIVFGMVRTTIDRLHLRTFDRQVGAALGAVKGAVLCILITLFSVSLLGENVCRSVCTSRSGGYVAQALYKMQGIVPPEIATYVGPYVDHFQQEMIEHQNEPPAGPANDPASPGQWMPPQYNAPPTDWSGGLPAPGSWRPPDSWGLGANEAAGRIEPATGLPAAGQNVWNGAAQQIDWGQAAGQVLDGISRGWNQPR